jgi:phosphate transport system substrate-binding protein
MVRFGKVAGALAAALALTLVAAACSSDGSGSSASGATGATQLSGELNGAGSSAQQAAMQAWIATFTGSNPDLTINYDPSGSGAGREQFVAGGVDFAGSDAALEGDELKGAEDRCGGADNVIEIPQYISPIAVIFNVPGIDSLNMTPDTVAKIFNGDITKWNDQSIAADNAGVDLPDLAISPVHRSDESGTTENFADYLSQAAPDVWTYPVDGNWPVEGGEAADGTSGVVDAVTNGEGTIGYADASQAGGLGTVAVEVAGEFLDYSPEAAAAIVDASTVVSGRGKYDYAYTLDRTPDTAAYPIVLLSYGLACTQYDDAQTAANVQGYLSYVISPEGQQVAAENAGSAPISDALRTESQQALDAIAT